jgi:LysM domain
MPSLKQRTFPDQRALIAVATPLFAAATIAMSWDAHAQGSALGAANSSAQKAVGTAASTAGPLELRDNAPERYTVQRGDTLWSIATRFLKEPWRWPEFWRFNTDQIRNPHLIYPGQVLALDRTMTKLGVANSGLQPRVRLDGGEANAIPSIPSNLIEPFLSRPLVIDPDTLANAPQIVAAEEGRYNLGTGGRAYVKGIPVGTRDLQWTLYRAGRPLLDPETKEVLAHEAIYVGLAKIVRHGDPAKDEPTTIVIERSEIEVTPGDRLLPADAPRVESYMPRAPLKDIQPRVISVYGGRGEQSWTRSGVNEDRLDVADYDSRREAGPLQIVSLSRGTKDGVEVGHVLALHRSTLVENDRSTGKYFMGGPRLESVRLPEERYGLVFVFRTFENVSYALIVQSERTVFPGDIMRRP